jgi:hypothetical protein
MCRAAEHCKIVVEFGGEFQDASPRSLHSGCPSAGTRALSRDVLPGGALHLHSVVGHGDAAPDPSAQVIVDEIRRAARSTVVIETVNSRNCRAVLVDGVRVLDCLHRWPLRQYALALGSQRLQWRCHERAATKLSRNALSALFAWTTPLASLSIPAFASATCPSPHAATTL